MYDAQWGRWLIPLYTISSILCLLYTIYLATADSLVLGGRRRRRT